MAACDASEPTALEERFCHSRVAMLGTAALHDLRVLSMNPGFDRVVGYAARILGQSAARKTGHRKDVHSTPAWDGDTKTDPSRFFVGQRESAVAGERPP
jgi:hypothetical protein